jgi:aspartate/glutamate racemase
VAVLGGVITWEHRSYEPFLKSSGLVYVHHPAMVQRRSEQLIERIKINASPTELVEEFRALLGTMRADYAVEAIILGCTEFSCLGEVGADLPLIDSSRELAHATVRLALGEG